MGSFYQFLWTIKSSFDPIGTAININKWVLKEDAKLGCPQNQNLDKKPESHQVEDLSPEALILKQYGI